MTSIFNLRTLLRADAATCGVMGLALIAGASSLAKWTGIEAGFLVGAGALLLPISVFMLVTAQMRPLRLPAVHTVILGNAAWVVASLAIPLSGVIAPNALGWLFIGVQAIGVALLSALEMSATAAHSSRVTPEAGAAQ